MLNISLISDIHHGLDAGTKKSSAAAGLFKEFVDWHKAAGGNILVDLGDKITALDPNSDKHFISEVADWFSQIDCPKFHLLGNMELKYLSKAENSSFFKYEYGSRSVNIEGIHLVFWNADTKLTPGQPIEISEEELKWLSEDLENNSLPAFVFSHFPLNNGSFRGNHYFERAYKHHASYTEESGIKIREVLGKSRNVVMCINGHAHWNTYHAIDGIHYITVPALSELFPTFPEPTSAWTKISIGNEIVVKVHGRLPIEYRVPLPKLPIGQWIKPA